VGAKFRGETRVFRSGDATNFHANHKNSLLEAEQGVTRIELKLTWQMTERESRSFAALGMTNGLKGIDWLT
jgi:hypothetical protein